MCLSYTRTTRTPSCHNSLSFPLPLLLSYLFFRLFLLKVPRLGFVNRGEAVDSFAGVVESVVMCVYIINIIIGLNYIYMKIKLIIYNK